MTIVSLGVIQRWLGLGYSGLAAQEGVVAYVGSVGRRPCHPAACCRRRRYLGAHAPEIGKSRAVPICRPARWT